MSVVGAFVFPHPPVLVPAVGGGKEAEAAKTLEAFFSAADLLASLEPELIVFISPHMQYYSDCFIVPACKKASGGFAKFGAPKTTLNAAYDKDFAKILTAAANSAGARTETPCHPERSEGSYAANSAGAHTETPCHPERSEGSYAANSAGARTEIENFTDGEALLLDHGVTVPLFFLEKKCGNFKIVCVSVSGLPEADHIKMGEAIRKAADQTGRRTVIVASGDLSHKMSSGSPYGFAAEGPAFDKLVTDSLSACDWDALRSIDPRVSEGAAECGLRPFIMLSGALGSGWRGSLLSYEGPFGIGYAVCTFLPQKKCESAHVKLARQTLEAYVKTGRLISQPAGLPSELTQTAAGAFVSLKKHGELRGCIGTIAPTQPTLAAEIMQNAVSAGTGDPRFHKVTEDELPELVYSVDVLSAPEPASGPEMLDLKRYGVIVTHGRRRGLLLPDLDGVDTVGQQVAIALKKAGIHPTDPYTMERFEVVRYT